MKKFIGNLNVIGVSELLATQVGAAGDDAQALLQVLLRFYWQQVYQRKKCSHVLARLIVCLPELIFLFALKIVVSSPMGHAIEN